ncbi:MAG: DNA-binding protein [Xanthomonadales bacterium PRO7]|jgi:excisionase family DNA binding protein|nr:DNA-binding protein [Xanthomonadales bacterium PRO7]
MKLINKKGVMQMANCSKATVDRAREAGHLEWMQLGTAVRFDVADVEAWLNSCRRK